ncbi:MAG TPA: hypothetical protein VGD92_05940 [Sphingobacteriaceae bacterium]
MKDQIIAHLNDPGQLEKLYRSDKARFTRGFNSLYPEVRGNSIADFWNARLNYESDEIQFGSRREFLFVIGLAAIAGLIAKFPEIFRIDEEFFYPRNIGFILFPALAAFFAWKNRLPAGKIAVITGTMLAGLIFINTLPGNSGSDTLLLSCIHLVLFLWGILGFTFVGGYRYDGEKRLGFLKYNGDLLVMTALIMISAGLLTAITINLFSLIGLQIEEFYFKYIVIFGLPAAPIFGTYLIRTNPQLVGRVSPVIARIFSPLVLVMLVAYLGAMIYAGKDPYNDREFLMLFNVLLIGVMAIIFFSVAETSGAKTRAGIWILFLLSLVTIVVNGIALSAIIFRIAEYGVTPNRAAVLGGNLLILINLMLVTRQLYRVLFRGDEVTGVGNTIARYLPVYICWTVVVTFLFPLIFGFQ